MIKILVGGYEEKDEATLRSNIWKAVQQAINATNLVNNRIFLRLGEEQEVKSTRKG